MLAKLFPIDCIQLQFAQESNSRWFEVEVVKDLRRCAIDRKRTYPALVSSRRKVGILTMYTSNFCWLVVCRCVESPVLMNVAGDRRVEQGREKFISAMNIFFSSWTKLLAV